MFMRKSYLVYLLLLAALALRLASGPTANLSYVVIALHALKGREQALQAMFFSWLFSMLNSAIAPATSAAAVGRYVVLLAAAISAQLRRPSAPLGARLPANGLVYSTVW